MPMLSTFPKVFRRVPVADVASSFWISKNSSTRMPMSAIDPAIADVVIVETVEVVTVDIIIEMPLHQYSK